MCSDRKGFRLLYLCGLSENSTQEESYKSKSSDKFEDSCLDEPTPSKSNPSTPVDFSLQDLIKTMSSQLASLTSQFEEFKRKESSSSHFTERPPYSTAAGIRIRMFKIEKNLNFAVATSVATSQSLLKIKVTLNSRISLNFSLL